MSAENKSNNPEVESVFKLVENKKKIKVQLGCDTDIGGGRVNQDKYFIVSMPEHDVCAIGVADGHGKETGHIVAEISTKCMEELLKSRIAELIANPILFLEFCCDYIQEQIRIGLVEIMEKQDYKVKVDELSGVVSRRKFETQPWKSLDGGTTFSIMVLIGRKVYIANVGDSSALLCCKHPILKPSHIKYEKDAARPPKEILTEVVDTSLSTYIELTSDHSPENIEEYIRMRAFKCSDENPNNAEILCVYDNQYEHKPCCPPVFNISESCIPTIRPVDGSFQYYYKNVRKEKATYISDRYGENVLSVTRSFGDLKLNTLGVSNKFEIKSMDLDPIFEQLKLQIDAVKVDTETIQPLDPMTVCIVLASDGVWDNWIYDHVQKFVMDPSCLNAIAEKPMDGAQRVTKSFMLRNDMFAKKNFGGAADNATGIVMYITQE